MDVLFYRIISHILLCYTILSFYTVLSYWVTYITRDTAFLKGLGFQSLQSLIEGSGFLHRLRPAVCKPSGTLLQMC